MRFSDLRRKHGYTQAELAHLIDLNVTTISKWEIGENYPRRNTLKKLSNIFNLSESEILDAIDNSKSNDIND